MLDDSPISGWSRPICVASPSVLPSSSPRCSLSCQAVLLRLGAEEPPVLEFAQYTRVLDRSPEPVDQALWVLALARGDVSHSILRPFLVNLIKSNLPQARIPINQLGFFPGGRVLLTRRSSFGADLAHVFEHIGQRQHISVLLVHIK